MSDKPNRAFDERVVIFVALGLVLLGMFAMIAATSSARADCVATCTDSGHAPPACKEACW